MTNVGIQLKVSVVVPLRYLMNLNSRSVVKVMKIKNPCRKQIELKWGKGHDMHKKNKRDFDVDYVKVFALIRDTYYSRDIRISLE